MVALYLLERGVVAGADGVLELRDGLGRPEVVLPADAHVVVAAGVEHAVRLGVGRERALVAGQRLPRDLLQPDAGHARNGAAEVVVDQLGAEADGLEYLRAEVAADGRDAHAAEGLQQALLDGRDVVVRRLVRQQLRVQHPLLGKLVHGGEGGVRTDGVGAVTDQQREVHDLARLARLRDDAGGGAQALADQVMVQAGGGQQDGDRRVLGVHVAVGEDEDGSPVGDGPLRLLEDALEPLAQRLAVAAGVEEDVDVGRTDARLAGAAQAHHVLGGEDRMRQLEAAHVLGRLGQQVALGPDEAHQRHDELLAQRVDRRVGHLREELLEVGEQELRAVAKDGERRVVAHRADGLLPPARHGGDDHPQLLAAVAEGVLAAQQDVGVLGRYLRWRQQAAQLDAVVVDPAAIAALAGEAGLDLVVRHDAVLLQVDQQHFAGLKPPPSDDAVRRQVEHAGLGGDDDVAVVGDGVTRRPQPVAVQDGADVASVGEDEGGRAVPGLHDGGVVFVEGALIVAHVELRPPRLGHHHERSVGQRAAAGHEQLQHVVDDGGVAAALDQDGLELLDVLAEQVGGQVRLAGAHVVQVAAQGVDLAVVRQHAERLRQAPGREGVGAVALVHEHEGAGKGRVAQVRVEHGELRPGEHALVGDGAAGEAYDVELLGARQVPAGGLFLDAASDDVELALEGVGGDAAAGDEDLADAGLGVAGQLPEVLAVAGHLAPAEHVGALLQGRALYQVHAALGQGGLGGQEDHADGVLTRLGQAGLQAGVGMAEELVRYLQEQPGAVAGGLIAADGAAVLQVDEDLHGVLDDVMVGQPVEPGNETDAARVVLEGRIVQRAPVGHPADAAARAAAGVVRPFGSPVGDRVVRLPCLISSHRSPNPKAFKLLRLLYRDRPHRARSGHFVAFPCGGAGGATVARDPASAWGNGILCARRPLRGPAGSSPARSRSRACGRHPTPSSCWR